MSLDSFRLKMRRSVCVLDKVQDQSGREGGECMINVVRSETFTEEFVGDHIREMTV